MNTLLNNTDVPNTRTGLTRRDLLVRAAAGGGFMIGAGVLGSPAAQAQAVSETELTAWITIGSDESVLVLIPVTEMGQGTSTGLAQIVADELRVDWSHIDVEHAPVDPAHGGTNASPWGRFTGGSLGIRLFSPGLQQAAAKARQMLVMAAAARWGIPPEQCTAQAGRVSSALGQLSYGALASSAATMDPGQVPLNQYPRTVVGTSKARLDIPDKVTGAAQFGIDVFFPGMLFAAVKHCPTVGGTVASVGSRPAGALAVVEVGATGTRAATGVAVIGVTTWDAMRAVKALAVQWQLPPDAASNDTAAINSRAAWLMANATPVVAEAANAGQLVTQLNASGSASVHATYQLPYLAHAALEPLNCTVYFDPARARCQVWAPTQAPDMVMQTARALCPAGVQIEVTNTLLGGGFGRKFEQDFVREALQVALAYPGFPIKLTWSREQDFAYDQFRPMALSRIDASASLASGRITAWSNRIVTPSIAAQRGADPAAVDHSAVEGAVNMPYLIDTRQIEYVRHDATIPVGYWRSVGLSLNTFAVECAMDELATALRIDPIQFRLNHLPDGRLKTVLLALRTLSGWAAPAASGRARGVAIAEGFGSYVGQVAEISVNSSSGAVTVHRVSTVIDCGTAVNPNAIQAQMEGAVAMAMSATLWAQQTFVKGVPQVTNYNRYPMVKLQNMPQVDVQIISGGGLGGVGEPGVPCVAPAIANAYAALRGAASRKRSLPFFPGSTMGGL